MIRYYITSLATIISIVVLAVALKRRIVTAAIRGKRLATIGYTSVILLPYVLIPMVSYVVL